MNKDREEIEMNIKAKRKAFQKIGLVFVVIAIFISSTICLAQQGIEDLPDYYPESFSGDGCVDRITNNKIVIEDRLFKLSPEIAFHTLKVEYANRSRFRAGMRVGYIKNLLNEIESIWYVRNCR